MSGIDNFIPPDYTRKRAGGEPSPLPPRLKGKAESGAKKVQASTTDKLKAAEASRLPQKSEKKFTEGKEKGRFPTSPFLKELVSKIELYKSKKEAAFKLPPVPQRRPPPVPSKQIAAKQPPLPQRRPPPLPSKEIASKPPLPAHQSPSRQAPLPPIARTAPPATRPVVPPTSSSAVAKAAAVKQGQPSVSSEAIEIVKRRSQYLRAHFSSAEIDQIVKDFMEQGNKWLEEAKMAKTFVTKQFSRVDTKAFISPSGELFIYLPSKDKPKSKLLRDAESGRSKTVSKLLLINTGRLIAYAQPKVSKGASKKQREAAGQYFIKEIEYMNLFRGVPGIIQLHEVTYEPTLDKEIKGMHGIKATLSPGGLGLMMEYYEDRTLEHELKKRATEDISKLTGEEAQKKYLDLLSIAINLLTGLSAIHGQGLVHQDIKPGNIYLNRGTAVIGDFGEMAPASGPEEDLYAGTKEYVPPEQISLTQLGPKKDVWAMGLTLYKYFFPNSNFPQPRLNPYEPIEPFIKSLDQLAKANPSASPIIGLIKEMLEVDPDKRISAAAALQKLQKIQLEAQQVLKELPSKKGAANRDAIFRPVPPPRSGARPSSGTA